MSALDHDALLPSRRSAELSVQELEGEILIYDRSNDTAHCLSPLVGRVWQSCDGNRSRADVLADESELDEPTLDAILTELAEKSLLARDVPVIVHASDLSRRAFVGKAAAAAASAPLIVSILAPTAAHAASVAGVTPCPGTGSNRCPGLVTCGGNGSGCYCCPALSTCSSTAGFCVTP